MEEILHHLERAQKHLSKTSTGHLDFWTMSSFKENLGDRVLYADGFWINPRDIPLLEVMTA